MSLSEGNKANLAGNAFSTTCAMAVYLSVLAQVNIENESEYADDADDVDHATVDMLMQAFESQVSD